MSSSKECRCLLPIVEENLTTIGAFVGRGAAVDDPRVYLVVDAITKLAGNHPFFGIFQPVHPPSAMRADAGRIVSAALRCRVSFRHIEEG